jgi:hypothetical protein
LKTDSPSAIIEGKEERMTKAMIRIAAAFLLLSGLVSGQRLQPGEVAVFLKSGDRIIDKIVEISSVRLALATERNGEFPLRDLWMINFVNDGRDFPKERNFIETNDHYVFLKNGDVSSGRIVAFSRERRVFQFESGEEFPIGEVQRIYFSKNVPRGIR